MNDSTSRADCTCGNAACAVRAARGLTPFCRMSAPAPRTVRANEFSTYAAAAEYAVANGGRVLACGGILQGAPKRFVVVA